MVFSANNDEFHWIDSSGNLKWLTDAGDNASGGITVDGNGKVYFPQRNDGALLVFDLSSKTKVAEFDDYPSPGNTPARVSIAEDGTVYWAVASNNSRPNMLYALVNHGALIRSLTVDGQTTAGIDVDSEGNLYVGHKATSGAWTVKRLDPAGAVTNTVTTRGSGYYGGVFQAIDDVHVAGEFLYITEGSSRLITKLTTSGTHMNIFYTGVPDWAQDSVQDSEGYLFVIGGQNNCPVSRYSPSPVNGAWYIGGFGAGGGSCVGEGIALGPDDSMYLLNSAQNQVIKYGPYKSDGWSGELTRWGSDGNANGQFTGPRDIAADHLGNVFVLDTGNSRVQRFASDGTYLGQWGIYGNGPGQFDNATAISVDDQGNIYVLDQATNRIQVFAAFATPTS